MYFSAMLELGNDAKEMVRENADIVQIIGEFIQLKKSGNRFVGLCPFHTDHSPSLYVTPRLGIYKCFACGAGGDVFKFVQEHENLSFPDALRFVAEKAGIALPEKGENQQVATEQRDRRRLLLKANAVARDFFREQLQESTTAREYVEKRGISPEAREAFQLGWAPDGWDQLLEHAFGHKLSSQALIEAGLLVENDVGRKYDRFRGRLMFPIWNLSGHPIAFGGRTLLPEGKPKYLNSPETALYHKSRVLYGLPQARDAIASSREVVLVEGYMDVIALWQAGLRNVVSVSGTALTREHVQILKRFAHKAHLLFDGDAAGRQAVSRSLEPLLEAGIEIRVPDLPREHDPDSFAREKGKEGLEQLLVGGRSLVEFLTQPFELDRQGFSPERKEGFVRDCLQILARIPSAMVREEYAEDFRRRLDLRALPAAEVARPMSRNRAVSRPHAGPGASGALDAGPVENISTPPEPPQNWDKVRSSLEGQVLQLLLGEPALCPWALDGLDLSWMQSGDAREAIDQLLALIDDDGKLDYARFMESLSARQRDLVAYLGDVEALDSQTSKKQFMDTLAALEIRHLQSSIRSERDKQRILQHQKRIIEINRRRTSTGDRM